VRLRSKSIETQVNADASFRLVLNARYSWCIALLPGTQAKVSRSCTGGQLRPAVPPGILPGGRKPAQGRLTGGTFYVWAAAAWTRLTPTTSFSITWRAALSLLTEILF